MKKIILSLLLYFSAFNVTAQITIIKPDTMDYTSLHAVNGKVLYAHTSTYQGFEYELWATDGTTGGTQLVKDINPNHTDDLFNYFMTNGEERYSSCVYNDELYFLADDGVHGMEFWKSDGTNAGTNLFFETIPGLMGWDFVDNKVPSFCVSNGELFFKSGDYTNGYELWKTNGTVAGTMQVKDIYPGSTGSNPQWITSFNGKVYFTAKDDVHGWELFCSDGTTAGTYMVKDIVPGLNGAFNDGMDVSIDPFFKVVGNYLYFLADNDGYTPVVKHWWRTDGTANGTIQLETTLHTYDPPPGPKHEYSITASLNGEFIFISTDFNASQANPRLWKSDGTVAGTVQLPYSTALMAHASLMDIGSYLYIYLTDPDSAGLGITDGTASGMHMVYPFDEGWAYGISNPAYMNGNMFFHMGKWYDYAFEVQDRVVQSNGTTQGTIIYPGAQPRSRLIPLGNDFVFYGFDTTGSNNPVHNLYKLTPASLPPAAGWTPTSVAETNQEFSFEVFPNPASSLINIKTKNFDLNDAVINLVDLTGRTVHTQKTSKGYSSTIKLNIPANIIDGMYFINLRNSKMQNKTTIVNLQR